jgi:malate dehydrogenase (oxaloacetate-decarboxylating)
MAFCSLARASKLPSSSTLLQVGRAISGKASTSLYFDVKKDSWGNSMLEVKVNGIGVLRTPQINKGAAFTEEERRLLGLDGLLPPAVKTMQQQHERCYRRYSSFADPLQKYQYLRELQERNEHLYYNLIIEHLEEMLPIIYTPTVGEACRKYSYLYNFARGLSFSPSNIQMADEIVKNYYLSDIRMIVATDSSAILGIGDQGYGGMGIPIGKLALYTAAGGVSPFNTCPVTMDVGTNRIDLQKDSLYLGIKRNRMTGTEYMAFFESFVKAVKKHWPRAIIQWEDLSKDAAFNVLDRFRDEVSSFNDDVQGTGAVTLAGVISACKMLNQKLKDQTVVISGAGAGGAGVAWIIREGMKREGLSHEEAISRVFVLDSVGLLYTGRPKMEDYKERFCQTAASISGWTKKGATPDLMETVLNTKCTVLLGLSGIAGQFTEALVKAAAANCQNPIIFPLSNPNDNVEATPEDVFRWTNGKAMVACGSPFPEVSFGGKNYPIGQGNNAFIFPGLGNGSILAGASKITDNMIMEAAYALSEYTIQNWVPKGRFYPPVTEMRAVSVAVATRVIGAAIADGVATTPDIKNADADSLVRKEFWQPKYPMCVPVHY